MQTIVYYVDSAVYGGTEQALVYLLAGLDRRCWRPVLFHHPEPGLALLVEKTHKLLIKTVAIPRMRGARTIPGLPKFMWQLQQEQPVVFHAHLSWLLSCKYGLLGAALLRVPAVIATLQQFMISPWRRSIYLQQRLVANSVDQYVAVSEAVAGQLHQSFQVPAAKLKVIPNSIPFTDYNGPVDLSLRKQLSRTSEGWIVLTVARLDGQKGHAYLLEAARQIPEATFVFAGDGPERATLEAQVSRLGIQHRVIFLGYQKDIPRLLAACDLFVLPSIYEGLPLSILEAMAAGKAVVATAVGGTPEAVLDGKTGWLVPPKDPAALVGAMRRVLRTPGQAVNMGMAGKVSVRQKFSASTMVEHIVQTYQQLLEKNRIPRGIQNPSA